VDSAFTGTFAIRRGYNATVGDDRPFNSFNDFKQGNALRWASQHKATSGAAERLDQAYFAELLEYFGKECRGDVYGSSDVAQQADLIDRFSRQIYNTPDGIFTFSS
jgi:hypothetical protein